MLFRRIDTPAVAPVNRAEPLAPAETGQQALRRSLSALLGRQVQADVLSRLADGSFLVRVGATPLRMALPHNPAPGSQLAMKLATLDPRPTFELSGSGAMLAAEPWETQAQPAAAARSAAAYAAGTLAARAQDIIAAAAPQANAPEPAAHGAELPTLSPGARVIASVLGASSALPQQGPAIVAPAPLLPQPLPAPAELARHLRHAIAHSGLFYESHLAEWAAGARTLQDLGREPQAARPPATPSTDPDSARMVDQQLAAHEHARVSWQGQPWPGLPMHWEIRREAPRGRDGEPQAESDAGTSRDDAGEATWRSELRFSFAGLGEVAATVVLSGGRAHILVEAPGEDTCAVLRSHAQQLGQALDTAGVPLAGLGIGRGGGGDA